MEKYNLTEKGEYTEMSGCLRKQEAYRKSV